MLSLELENALNKYKKKVFIYEWEYFTKRIHDELMISVLEKYQFLYVEINFEIIQKELPKKPDQLKFWHVFFEQISQKRYSDLCGFLENNKGVALIFTHSNTANNNVAWFRFCENILNRTGFDMQKWDEISLAEYPPKEFLTSSANN